MKLLSSLLLPLRLGGRGSAGGTGAGPPSGLFTGFARGRDRACLPPRWWRTVGAQGASGRGAVGPPGLVDRPPLTVTLPAHPRFERGRDRFCLKEIAAQQVRTRLGSGMWKYDSEQLLDRKSVV